MNKLSNADRFRIIACMVESNFIRATCRITGFAKNIVSKLLADIGAACAAYHDKHVRDVTSKRIQCDEIWSFVGMKEKNVPQDRQGEFGVGSVWTWTAIDADSKLIVSYMVGLRDAGYAVEFMNDVAGRLSTSRFGSRRQWKLVYLIMFGN